MSVASEKKTIRIMISLYCKKVHKTRDLCPDCARLLGYSENRIDHCPQDPPKPPCNACKIHCYKPDMRQAMKTVMRFSGPRMTFIHPLIAIRHLVATVRAKRRNRLSQDPSGQA